MVMKQYKVLIVENPEENHSTWMDENRFIFSGKRQFFAGPLVPVEVFVCSSEAVELGDHYVSLNMDSMHHGLHLANTERIVEIYPGRMNSDGLRKVISTTMKSICNEEEGITPMARHQVLAFCQSTWKNGSIDKR